MASIVKATLKDAEILASIGKISFIESHGKSAKQEDIDAYVNLNYTTNSFLEALNNSENNYYIIIHEHKPVGYSNIVFNARHSEISLDPVAKLDRIYILNAYHQMKLGLELFNFNMQLSIKNHQVGMWLFVWTENRKAVNFYKKAGFNIISYPYFKISERHSNPNYQMLLTF